MVLNAIDLARRGHSVRIYDQHTFGGAWRPYGVGNEYSYDDGVHILYWQKGLNEKLIRELNDRYELQLVTLNPSPRGDRCILGFGFPEFSFPVEMHWREILRAIKTIVLRIISGEIKYYYFLHGCFGLQQRLLAVCGKNDIQVITNEKINSITKEDDQLLIKSENEVKHFDCALASSRILYNTDLEFTKTSSQILSKKTSGNEFDVRLKHIFLSVQNPGPVTFSVFKFTGGHPIFAVSDIRCYVSEDYDDYLKSGERAIYSFAMNPGRLIPSVSDLLSELVARKLCSPSATIISHSSKESWGPNIPESMIRDVNVMGESILYFYRYDNLSKGLKQHLRRPVWQQLKLA